MEILKLSEFNLILNNLRSFCLRHGLSAQYQPFFDFYATACIKEAYTAALPPEILAKQHAFEQNMLPTLFGKEVATRMAEAFPGLVKPATAPTK